MTVNEILHKVIAYGFGALTVGAGTVVMTVTRNDAVQDQKIVTMQSSLEKLDAINATVNKVDAKVDVLNQKFDDAENVRHK